MNKGERVLIYTRQNNETVNISIGWVTSTIDNGVRKIVTVQQNKGGQSRFYESGQSISCNNRFIKKG